MYLSHMEFIARRRGNFSLNTMCQKLGRHRNDSQSYRCDILASAASQVPGSLKLRTNPRFTRPLPPARPT